MTVAENGGAAAVADFLRARREQLAQQWADLTLFRAVHTSGRDVAVHAAHRLVDALTEVARDGRVDDVTVPALDQVRAALAQMIAARSQAGATPPQVAAEVAELKRPVIAMVGRELADADRGAALIAATDLMGTLRLVGMEISLSDEGAIVARQRRQLSEVATPVLKLWDRVVAVPLIGTLDSARTQVVMETLLEAIVDQHAAVAILDITGVPLVDTVVAQHLMKTALAVRLMGARCVVSGIRPQIAQTIVQLGIDLGDITTRATLADALEWALGQVGTSIGRA
ncbi:STAS domain-containing protein [Actinoallomurus spadix]|uniref:STAS domain-containing protein n=1 Tax=Actinoallomurus spadix TaxID=79912 RepID=A0ABP3FG76_9ACTN|nr:STAS domain-containing protein [Actinoallomurus spadix]MCO5990778.1 STAS domain-containing protein [Actinoallomurus spadix]